MYSGHHLFLDAAEETVACMLHFGFDGDRAASAKASYPVEFLDESGVWSP